MSRIAVLGAGAWGTALAVEWSSRHEVRLWSHAHADEIASARENQRYLAGVKIGADVGVTASLAAAVEGAEIVAIVTPSEHLPEVARAIAPLLQDGCVALSASKGLQAGTHRRMTAVMRDCIANPVAALSGPTFAQELAAGMPTACVAACDDDKVSRYLQDALSTASLRIYRSTDVVGVELGGALKNIIAIAAGIVAGLDLGSNTQAALVTRGIAEITRLAVACGAQRETLSGLAGMGDLVLTCTGPLSRNRTVGVELGKGLSLDSVLRAMDGKVAEGVRCTAAARELAAEHGVEMPIVEQMHAILYAGRTPREAIQRLMARPGAAE